MTLETRYDGSQYPNSEADDAVLREVNPSAHDTKLGYAYHRTIGELVIELLAGAPLTESSDKDPENWQSLENAMVVNAALEVKAISAAFAYEQAAGEITDEFSHTEVQHLLRSLSRRLEAGAELAKRMRRARWGHPAFGGGEGWQAEQAAKAQRDLEVLKQAAEVKAAQ